MIRIIANEQGGTDQTVLDVSEITTVQISYSVAELGDVMSRNAPFSQTFRLPQSERNNKFFEHYYQANLTTATFNAAEKTRVSIYEDGVLILAGVLRLMEVYLDDRSYQVSVFGDAANLFQDLKDKDLVDAFITNGAHTTTYDYQQSAANVVDSWTLTNDITTGTVGDGTIIVPLIDWGKDTAGTSLYYGSDGVGGTGLGTVGFLNPTELKPAIKLQALINLIFAQAGYSYTSTFLTSATFARIYMQLGTNSPQLSTRPYAGVNVGLSGDVSLSGSDLLANPQQLITFNDESSFDFFDPDGLYNSTTHSFNPPQDMNLTFSVKLRLEKAASDTFTGYVVVQGATDTETSPPITFATSTKAQVVFNGYLVADAGEDVQVYLVTTGFSAGGVTIKQSNELFGVTDQSTFEFDGYINPEGNQQVSVPTSMPDMTQEEFLKDIIQRFNLVLEASVDNERHLFIEPHSDWLDAGAEQDWTGKLDLDKERVLKPTSDKRKAIIELGDLEGNDRGNTWWQDHQGYGYGQYRENIEDDFATGELNNEPVFKPFHVQKLPAQDGDYTLLPNVVIGRQYEFDEGTYSRVADEPFLFYHNGLKDTGATLYVGSNSFTQYPFISAFSEGPTTEDTQSLYWGYQSPYGHGTPPMGNQYVDQNLFRKYWGRFINQVYSDDARILEAYFYLKSTDILNLRFNDLINVEGVHYRLLKVQGYTVNGYETTKCTLLKDQGRLQYRVNLDCGLTPHRYYLNGTIQFINPETSATTFDPGEACCTRHDGIYEDNLCYWRTPRGGGQVIDRERRNASERNGAAVQRATTLSGTSSAQQRTYIAEVEEGSTAAATVDGAAQLGLAVNTIVSGQVLVNSVQTTFNGTDGSIGSADAITYSFKAENIEGTTAATITEITAARITDGDATGNRAVAISVSGDSIVFTCTGETYGRVNFVLNVNATSQEVNRALIDQDTLLLESGESIVTENATRLQE